MLKSSLLVDVENSDRKQESLDRKRQIQKNRLKAVICRLPLKAVTALIRGLIPLLRSNGLLALNLDLTQAVG
jgi:hypothetical protein